MTSPWRPNLALEMLGTGLTSEHQVNKGSLITSSKNIPIFLC